MPESYSDCDCAYHQELRQRNATIVSNATAVAPVSTPEPAEPEEPEEDEDAEPETYTCRRCYDVYDVSEDDVSICEECEHVIDTDGEGGCCTCTVCNYPVSSGYGYNAYSPRRPCGVRTAESDQCSGCDRCPDHCECHTCGSCGDRVTEYCGDCNRCDSCGCRCGDNDASDTVIWRRAEEVVFHDSPTFKRNPVKRYIACELEVASMNAGHAGTLDEIIRDWDGCAVVEDGSLPASGFEINTAPTSGDRFCDRIEELSKMLIGAGGAVTSACGYHVHIDARDLSYANILTLIRVYARLEPAMFNIVPKARRSSTYCVPCGDKYLQNGLAEAARPRVKSALRKKAVHEAVYGEGTTESHVESYKRHKYNEARYSALNLHSWLYRGSVEIRTAAGTINAKKVICWAIFWAAVVQWAKRHHDAHVDKLPTDPWECMLALAPTDEVKVWLTERREEHWPK